MAGSRYHVAEKQDFLCSCYTPFAISSCFLLSAISHQLYALILYRVRSLSRLRSFHVLQLEIIEVGDGIGFSP
jgi:hypothetical protein